MTLRCVVAAFAVVLCAACSSSPPRVPDAGSPCDGGTTLCQGSCTTLTDDNANCGACGTACGSGQACAGGGCLAKDCPGAACAPYEVCSGSACIDRACVGITCPMGQVCARGTCFSPACSGTPCATSEVCVSGACVDRACAGVICPMGKSCRLGLCIAPTCNDGLTDGDESDRDCGGSCGGCGVGKRCGTGKDCQSDSCVQGRCQAADACADGMKDGRETDADCGGGDCPLCAAGKACVRDVDCVSGVCTNGICASGTCNDRVQDGRETDIDCGGDVCDGCGVGRHCAHPADCSSGQCVQNLCISFVTCSDAMKDGTETDVDCGGGACDVCTAGKTCLVGSDCQSGLCTAGQCAPGSCTDQLMDGVETDVDCGGPICNVCAFGKGCAIGLDCASGVCTAGHCAAAATCSDGMVDGKETDTDCGGPQCPRCMAGKKCQSGNDCSNGLCSTGLCGAGNCTDGTKNGVETDVDCGGTVCTPCDLGLSCNVDTDCKARACNRYQECSATHYWFATWPMPDSVTPFCSDGNVNEIPCPSSGSLFGQDGNYQINVPSYTLTADTAVDSVTKLEWQRVSNRTGLTWKQAFDYCDTLTLGGNSDWRLPSLIEVTSYNSYDDPLYIDTMVFPYPPGWVQMLTWTASEFPGVSYAYGTAQGAHWYSEAEMHEVRCVRRGTPAPTSVMYSENLSFVDDPFTHLIWERSPPTTTITWQAALARCEALTLDSQSDWRLPNIKELTTLVDSLATTGLAAAPDFGLSSSTYYWSSTVDRNYFAQAMSVHFAAPVDIDSKVMTGMQLSICVRAGQ
jgi:hypothetical protein